MNKLNKIHNHLRLNYPILWNLKIVYALIGALIFNLLFFFIGYSSRSLFYDYYYNSYSDLAVIYFFSGIASVLSFILWMVFYSRNNAIKRFYSLTSKQLYVELLLTFVIITSFVVYPYSLQQGTLAKERSYLSEKEAMEGAEILSMVGVLIPTDRYQYEARGDNRRVNSMKQPVDNSGSLIEIDTLSENIATRVERNKNEWDCSLLNYHSDEFYSIDVKTGYAETLDMLKANDSLAVKSLMVQFLNLEKKHGLVSNVSLDTWFNLIYNYPDFPVTKKNLISTSGSRYNNGGYYLNFSSLKNSYETIIKAHQNFGFWVFFPSVYLTVALGITMLVFSFRLTSGRQWLVSVVVLGLLFLFWALTLVLTSGSLILSLLFWILLFAGLLIKVATTIKSKSAKGRSAIYLNLVLFGLPYILLLVYWFVGAVGEESCHLDFGEHGRCLHSIISTNYITFINVNVLLVLVMLWFTVKQARKWKSLPDE